MRESRDNSTILKISDLCVVTVAMGVGTRLSLLSVTTVGWPFNYWAIRAISLGSFVLCPLVFFKQFVIERRKTVPLFGESLWIISFFWMFLIACCILLGSAAGSILLFIVVGMIMHPAILACSCIYLVKIFVNRRTMILPWSDVWGCAVTALFSAGFIVHILFAPLEL